MRQVLFPGGVESVEAVFVEERLRRALLVALRRGDCRGLLALRVLLAGCCFLRSGQTALVIGVIGAIGSMVRAAGLGVGIDAAAFGAR